jgi:hypothetical protein
MMEALFVSPEYFENIVQIKKKAPKFLISSKKLVRPK